MSGSTIPFQQIPNTLRIPFFFAETDASGANLGSGNQPALIIAQMTSAGTATAGQLVLCQGVAWAKTAFGPGSMAALMVAQYRKSDPLGTLYVLPLADNGSGTAATGSMTFTAAATSAGTFSEYLGGQRVQMPVLPTQTTANLATAWAAAVNAVTDLLLTAAVDGSITSKVNYTAKHKGADAGDLVMFPNFMSQLTGDTSEQTPPGLTVTRTGTAWTSGASMLTGGAGNPTITTALATLGDQRFDFIAMPYTDSTNLNALQSYLGTTWSYLSMLYGGGFGAYRGTLSARTSFGTGRNDPGHSMMGFYGAPEPSFLWAAEYCAAAAVSLRADPGLPFNNGVALNVLPPLPRDRDAKTDRDTLLHDGISTYTVSTDNKVLIERAITTYQTNAQGQPDDSWLNVQRRYCYMASIRDLRNYIETKYARFKLVEDGDPLPPGARITTAAHVLADAVGRYGYQARALGIVQDVAGFKATAKAARHPGVRNRVDLLYPIVPIDQLEQVAVLGQLRNASSISR